MTGSLIKLTVLLSVAALLTAVLTTVAGDLKIRDTVRYRAAFSEVSGLAAGEQVRIAGVDVGRVQDVRVTAPDTVEVAFDVDASLPVMVGSRAIVRYKNLVGDRYLEVADGPGPANRLEPDGLIPRMQTQPALDLDELYNGFKPLFEGLAPEQINALSSQLIAVLQGQSGTVESLLGDIGSLTTTLADRDQVIGQVVDNLNAVLATVGERDRELSDLIVAMQELATGLADDRERIGTSIQGVADLTGTLAGVVDEVRPPLQGSVAELGRTAGVLERKRADLDEALRLLPPAYGKLGRVGLYANTFNFYICGLALRVTGPDGRAIETPEIVSQAERCQFPS